MKGDSLMFPAAGQLVFLDKENFSNLTSFQEKPSVKWSNQAGGIILTTAQFVCCPALNETHYYMMKHK